MRVSNIVCRYLNSGLPVLVITKEGATHAFVLCGYQRKPGADNPAISLIYHDDMRGPYLTAGDIESAVRHDPPDSPGWDVALAPVPDKLWLEGEAAEPVGEALIRGCADWALTRGRDEVQRLLNVDADGHLTFRTYAIESRRHKERLAGRKMPPELVRAYRLARWPRIIWVVEAIDRRLRDQPDTAALAEISCVLGEAILDATTTAAAPGTGVLAIRLPGVVYVRHTDKSTESFDLPDEPYATGGVGPP